jgi:FixJ family two-component response regulator
MIAQHGLSKHFALDDADSDFDIPTIFVVDPDSSTSNMVRELLAGFPYEVRTCASGREFFAAYDGDQPGCIVLEQRIADASGLQIQRRLAERNQRLPMVFVTAEMDVATAVVLMRGGAVHVVEKPIRSIELLDAIEEALALDKTQRREDAGKRRMREAIATLTYKERQLVSLLATASSSKAVSAELSIGARAVELRRRAIMAKLGLESSLELVRFALLAREEIGRYLDAVKPPSDDFEFV